jgi:YegS/Rv2252/BmrU family lipid kinase
MPDLLLIVNPHSANGSTGRRWPAVESKLRSLLPPFDVAFSERQGHATAIAREAADRYGCIALVGGDGTVNEVANGLIADDRPLRSDLTLGVICRGTGSDFIRTLGIPRDLEGAAERLATGNVREIDIGKIRYRSPAGSEAIRYFLNEVDIGMGAVVSDRVNRSSKRLGGRLSFLRATLLTALRYRPHLVSLSLDGAPAEPTVLGTAWFANGQYSGGGIRMAPRARPDDGLLDVVCIGNMSQLQKVTFLPKLRSGAFVDLPQVTYRTARRIETESAEAVPIATEGEYIGTLPATFEIIGERLKVIV